jgi:hypothetical protein
MKIIFLLSSIVFSVAAFAQPKTISQAVITTKTTISSEDGDNIPPPPPGNEEGRVIMRFGGDGETKSTTYLKNNLVKTVVKTDFNIITTIRDNDKKITTNLIEMNGTKTGTYSTDEEQAARRKQMDSLMKVNQQNNSRDNNTPPTFDVAYVDGTKKIAGIECKKAVVIRTRSNGKTDSSIVWYAPDFKLQGITTTGGATGGFGGFLVSSPSNNGLDKINGFPMQYVSLMGRGRTITVEVTKIELDKEIKDKDFDIPKDFELKAMKDVQMMGGGNGGPQIRMITRDN